MKKVLAVVMSIGVGFALGAEAATTVIDGVTSNHPGNYSLPGGDTLIVTNGGDLNVGDYAYMGDGGDGSYTIVSGSGSSMTSGDGLWVGRNGADNVFVLSDGATYANTNSGDWEHWDFVGRGCNSNRLEITGAGSRWTAGNRFAVGWDNGLYNTLVISNGGVLDVTVNHFLHTEGYSNQTLVTDGGMLDVSGGGLFTFGSSSDTHGNTIRFENGGILTNAASGGSMRFGSGGSQGEKLMVFDGASTRGYWNGSVYLGQNADSPNNTLRVQNGAEVYLDEVQVNYASNAGNSEIVIDGADSLLDIGSYMHFGDNEYSPDASLVITNGGRLAHSHSGNTAFLGYTSDETDIVVDGAGSQLDVYYDASFADSAADSTLTVRNGGGMHVSNSLMVGINSVDHGNTLTVDGSGSSLTVDHNLLTGYGDDTFRVSNGGTVNVGDYAYMGLGDGGTSIVTGAGTTMTSGDGLSVGHNGDNHTFILSGGATYANTNEGAYWHWDYVGDNGNSNRLEITGPGTRWTAGNRFSVGNDGGLYNTLVISNDALLEITSAHFIHSQGYSNVGSSRVDLQACKLEYSIVSPK